LFRQSHAGEKVSQKNELKRAKFSDFRMPVRSATRFFTAIFTNWLPKKGELVHGFG
jgi:hypothetical protein